MKVKTVILASSFLGLFISSVFACWDKKPQFRWTQLLRYDPRQSEVENLQNQKQGLYLATIFFPTNIFQ